MVALKSHYHVYIGKNGIDNGHMQPIETIAIHGQHSKLIMYNHKNLDMFCIIGNIQPNNELRLL